MTFQHFRAHRTAHLSVSLTLSAIGLLLGPLVMDRRPFPPDRQQRVLAGVMACITRKKNLNPKRRHRTYPRVIKRARHNSYRVKRPSDRGTRHNGPPTIVLVNLPTDALAA